MNTNVELKQVSGQLRIPASKSMSQRVFAAALLHKGSCLVLHSGNSEDEQAALSIIRQLGAIVSTEHGHLKITGRGRPLPETGVIHCGESGLAARLFTPVAALCTESISIGGSGSLLTRPMDTLLQVLPQLGVQVSSNKGCLPLTVQGPLIPGDIVIDGSLSSQFISGLLFAYSCAAQQKTSIRVTNAVSSAYLDLSLEVLALFGKTLVKESAERFMIDPALFQVPDTVTVAVEGDWSSAAFWVAAAAINGNITLSGLNKNSSQPDKAISRIVAQCGADVCWKDDQLQVSSRSLTAFHYDATDSPDLFPVLAVLAACCEGESSICGLHRLQHKESNREASTTQLLSALGIPYRKQDNTLYITGIPVFQAAVIDSFNDHRIVMAATLSAIRCSQPVRILQADAVRKSYPGFFEDISRHSSAS